MSSVSRVLTRLSRSSIVSQQSRSFLVRGDEFKEREEAFESQYVKQKEREELRRLAEKKKQEEASKANTTKVDPNAAKIKEIESQISKLQKELAALKK